jgi:hypothetical protein
MRPFEQFVEKTLKDFETRLKTRDMTESARRACMTCAKEFAATSWKAALPVLARPPDRYCTASKAFRTWAMADRPAASTVTDTTSNRHRAPSSRRHLR